MATRQSKLARVYCNECRRKTLHRLLKTATSEDSEVIEDTTEIFWATTFEMLQCCGCEEVVLRRTFRFSEDPEDEVSYFPPAVSRRKPDWLSKLTPNLRFLLEEVYRALDANSRRLPIMGARTLLDMVMNEKVGDIGGFAVKLRKLEAEGFVSAKNREVLEAALDAGSAAAHRGHAATMPEILTVMDIVENLLQAVYILPREATKLKQSTPARPSGHTIH